MIVETNLIELNKITLKNYNTYNEKIKYEIHKISTIPKNSVKPKETVTSAEIRKQEIKKYQHEYYLKVTKPKRKAKKE